MTKLSKQPEIPGTEEAFNDELSKALHELRHCHEVFQQSKEDLDNQKEKVVIEMKKSGKDYLRIQLGGQFWEAEVKRTEEKLSFKKSKV